MASFRVIQCYPQFLLLPFQLFSSNPGLLAVHQWELVLTAFETPTWNKRLCSSIFKQRGLSQQGSVFHPCNMPHSQKREGDGKTSRQLFEWRIGVDIGIALFRLAAGWGGLGNAMLEWTGRKARAWSSLNSPAHVCLNFYGLWEWVHGHLVHYTESSRTTCPHCFSPLRWTSFVKPCVHFIKP